MRPTTKRFSAREGRLKTKLRALLLCEGFDCDFFWEQQGYFRIHGVECDIASWGVYAWFAGQPVSLHCWETMTECVKYGITVSPYDSGDYVVISKKSLV
jgi:hypothetical protein